MTGDELARKQLHNRDSLIKTSERKNYYDLKVNQCEVVRVIHQKMQKRLGLAKAFFTWQSETKKMG
jgi:plasmid stabilization system protein ParE